jgi:hypothetical protein
LLETIGFNKLWFDAQKAVSIPKFTVNASDAFTCMVSLATQPALLLAVTIYVPTAFTAIATPLLALFQV